MDRWQAMKIFVRVAEAESFAEAARQLRISPPAVTRAISSLEDQIGVRLLARTTRSVKMTEAGRRYFEDCRRILADIADAEASAAGSHGNPTGALIVTGPVMFGRMHVLPILLEYLDRFPSVTGQTLFVDRPVNIVEEGIDVAIRIGNLPDSGLSATRVGWVRRTICGAPSYFERHGVPRSPADLAHHRVIMPTGAWVSPEWHFGADSRTSVTVHPRLLCNTNEAAITAAEQGWGITRVLSYQVAPALAAGRLQPVLEDHLESPIPVHVVHAAGRHATAKVRAFVDLAVERLRSNSLLL
ncbi:MULTISPECIES: LysR family transcriptional regulator [unclassified Novosphingobium]|nr:MULTISPECIES: LysR family transcriptional regulator [unclassified Novosphingobium]KPH66266.1 LysR family transcriptional regulator [Novosphingobium sp. ST904]TCM38759.1 LysR family transcriptional regulator [Novosphingobium sp. ST904]WRT95808.1 LysR family transcriptional regulator [Novosphingobium sp. RL4]